MAQQIHGSATAPTPATPAAHATASSSGQFVRSTLIAAVIAAAAAFLTMRPTPVLNNMLAWFVGLVAFFALHPENILTGLSTWIVASTVGAGAGYACQRLQQRFAA